CAEIGHESGWVVERAAERDVVVERDERPCWFAARDLFDKRALPRLTGAQDDDDACIAERHAYVVCEVARYEGRGGGTAVRHIRNARRADPQYLARRSAVERSQIR